MSGKTGKEVATSTACPTGYYSPSAYDFCIKIPWGFKPDAAAPLSSTMTACGTGFKATAAGTFIACVVPESCLG